MDVKPQPAKHQSPKLVTDSGMVMDVREWQRSKHLSPKLVTDDGMFIEVREWHSEKQ